LRVETVEAVKVILFFGIENKIAFLKLPKKKSTRLKLPTLGPQNCVCCEKEFRDRVNL
jgi:hypothetical protein